MIMKKTFYILLFLLCAFSAVADKVKVRVYSTNTIQVLNASFDLGVYNLIANDNRVLDSNLGEGVSVIFTATSQGVSVDVNGEDYGTFKQVALRATDTACILCLNPKNVKQRTYEGDLIISTISSSSLKLINEVEFETYLAGVVQSEIYGSQSDIFRIQAIISRTWALRNLNKHAADGYNFCDQVHCQAYLNRCIRPDIMLGTIQSTGETIVDQDENLIETPFHSNSGGQTANSEDVWRNAVPYLRSVPDTFSYRMKQSDWNKVVSQDKWLNYFAKNHHLDINNDSIRNELLTFTQDERKTKIAGVPLTRVRVDFQLKSTFFSVSLDEPNHNVVLNGHGYGHGVGLSQEGTIRMVNLGYSYDEIIKHYYTGSHIHHDATDDNYVRSYVNQIQQIIAADMANPARTKSKKDDWLGQLFSLRARQDREEVYDDTQTLDDDWQYDW